MGVRQINNPQAGFRDLFTKAAAFDSTGKNVQEIVIPSGMTASGGIVSDYISGSDIYRSHVFAGSGTFSVSSIGDYGDGIEYMVIAGGGAGGPHYGAGGGAGGFRTNLSGHPLAGAAFPAPASGGDGSGNYTITVGAGGAGGAEAWSKNHTNGSNSYFGPPSTPNGITSTGGGKGGANTGSPYDGPNGTSGSPGGSGGGAKHHQPTYSTITAGEGNSPSTSPSQGNDGGNHSGNVPGSGCGGGGGAGGAGQGGQGGGDGGHGGLAVQCLIAGPTNDAVGAPGPGGSVGWYAGGGGGGGDGSSSTGGAGPTGGGPYGGGGDSGPGAQPNALAFTGGGGGGRHGPLTPGASGGSGCVVIRYQIGQSNNPGAPAKATGGSISRWTSPTGAVNLHTFVNSGTFTAPTPLNPGGLNVEVFMVAGGAGGGGAIGGGGGAGGAVFKPGVPMTLDNGYAIVVGGGGMGGTSPTKKGTAGTDTTAFGLTAKGGGGGGYGQGGGAAGDAGGSSGGTGSTSGSDPAGATQPTTSNPGAPVNVGYAGGPGAATTNKGGGGGGAGGAATGEPLPATGAAGTGGLGIQVPAIMRDPAQRSTASATPLYGGGGGLGYPGPSSSFHWFAGGGGGGAYNPAPSTGGAGGGSPSAPTPYAGAGMGRNDDPLGNPAGPASGSGGGGGGYQTSGGFGGKGGSGIVIVAYPI